MPSFTVEADGKVIPFEAPAGASPQQIKTLAARALKRETGKPHQTPVLERGLMERLAPKDQGSISAYKPTLAEKISDKAAGALSFFGMDERRAHRLGDKITSALSDLTPVGAATSADDARRAFGRGDYLAGVGNSALAALSAVPELGAPAKAMFLGVAAKTADRAALYRAEKMLSEFSRGNDFRGPTNDQRKQIWNETGWFQGSDGKWRFEVPDNEIAVSELPTGGYANRLENIVRHDAVQEAYPTAYQGAFAAVTRDPSLNGSWEEGARKLRLNPILAPDKMRSTAAHELQHFVQGQEGFARGGMIGPIREIPEAQRLQQEHDDVWEELALRLDQDEADPAIPALRERYAELSKRLEPFKYESYRRLAGEVEARNVQTRLDMTPGQRREYAPWETEDVPREDQFVLWHGDAAGSVDDWFKGSHLIDDDMNPLAVHHFTYNDFDFKDFDRQWAAKHFGRDPEGVDTLGAWFTDNPDARYVNPEWGGRRIDAHLAVKKPLYLDDTGVGGGEAWSQLQAMTQEAGGATKLREKLRAQGYDGIILNGTLLDGVRQNAILAFEPDQVRVLKNEALKP